MAEAIRCETQAPILPVYEGELVRVTGVFTDLETGASVDPAVVKFIYRRPDEERKELVYGTDVAVVREEAGVFHIDLLAAETGTWNYRWQSAEDKIGVAEGQVTVLPSGVA